MLDNCTASDFMLFVGQAMIKKFLKEMFGINDSMRSKHK